MEEETIPTETTDQPTEDDKPTVDDLPTTDDLPITDDFTDYVDLDVTDDRSLMGTVLQYVFGNVDVMVLIVSVMVLVTILIISTDFMRWKGRE